MKKEITISYEETNELYGAEKMLMEKAIKISEKAYAPYSGFKVGAAVLSNDGIFTGCNQENMAFSPTICGERVAMFSAACQSDSPIKIVAIYCQSDKYDVTEASGPCGVCRQVMSEFEMRYGKKIRVVLKGGSSNYLIFDGVENLLPFSFDGLKNENL